MRKNDLTVVSVLMEAVDLILTILYIGLQLYYGIYYHVKPLDFIANILVLILVYVVLTWLQMYPEKLNQIPAQICVGNVRKYSLRLLLLVKLIFTAGLLVPCICDVAGVSIRDVYSLVMIGLIIVAAVYYEYRIISELRRDKNDK